MKRERKRKKYSSQPSPEGYMTLSEISKKYDIPLQNLTYYRSTGFLVEDLKSDRRVFFKTENVERFIREHMTR